MRTTEWTSQFKRDYERESKGRYEASLENDLSIILDLLANDLPLEQRHFDHELVGKWKNVRDCHVKPDLVLIYLLVESDTIRLVRLGSNSTLDI